MMRKTRAGEARERSGGRYVLLLLALACAGSLRYFRFCSSGWPQVVQTFTYAYGFIQRALIGTAIDLVSRGLRIPLGRMRFIYAAFTTAVFLLVLLAFFRWASSRPGQSPLARRMLMALGVLFFAGPGWTTYYYNFGHTDVWLIIPTVLLLYLVYRKRYWALLAIPAVCLLSHPGYIFMYYGVAAAAALYALLTDGENRRRVLLWSVLSLLCCGALFVYFQFFSHARAGVTPEDVAARVELYLSSSKDPNLTAERFLEDYGGEFNSYLFGAKYDLDFFLGFKYYGRELALALVLYAPFFLELIRYFADVRRAAARQGRAAAAVHTLLPWIGIIAALPLFFMQVDYGRWCYTVFFYEFALLFYGCLQEDPAFLAASASLRERAARLRPWFSFLLVYWVSLGMIHQNYINETINQMSDFFQRLLAVLVR